MASAFRLDPEFAPLEDAPALVSAALVSEDHTRLFVLGTDRHDLPVPMARMVENVLDWEHLPWVHPENFVSSELVARGPRWYRARFGNAGSPPTFNQVLVVLHAAERTHSRWSILLEEGPRAGHLVYTTAERVDEERIVTHVTFYSPEAPRNEPVRKAMLRAFQEQYDQIYDQDCGMMRDRQNALNRLAANTSDVPADGVLGTVAEVEAKLPLLVSLQGRRFWIRQAAGGLEAVAADCPHRLGLLPCPAGVATVVTCPLHGYTFDRSAGCSADGRGLRLARPPKVAVTDGEVRLGAAPLE